MLSDFEWLSQNLGRSTFYLWGVSGSSRLGGTY